MNPCNFHHYLTAKNNHINWRKNSFVIIISICPRQRWTGELITWTFVSPAKEKQSAHCHMRQMTPISGLSRSELNIFTFLEEISDEYERFNSLFSCPDGSSIGDLVTESLSQSVTHTPFDFRTYRVTLEICDLWVIWSERWEDMTWSTIFRMFNNFWIFDN